MDQTALRAGAEFELVDPAEQRSARRFTLLIRPAKLASTQGEFVCVLRDVSRTGVSAKLFHKLPSCEEFTLELQNGQTYAMCKVWEREGEAGFEFVDEIDVNKLISEASEYQKRGLRLTLHFPITITTLSGAEMAFIENISQQGARFECGGKLAIDQNVRIAGEGLRETRAKIRWRRAENYGVVFDDTFSLSEFAQFAAKLQCPVLLD